MNALPDFEHCYRAVASRDQRFDGWFFTAVTSTRIYCRPSCPAQTPKRGNVRFYGSAAAAQRAGFRACLRCRPDAAPGSPDWDVRADVAARAMRLIADGVVDRDGVPGLAGRLGYTERHLGRLLTAEVGAGPLALARAQRAQTARILIETTDLGFAEIAFAAGFGSVRQFNDTVQEVYGRTPSALRTNRQGPHRPGHRLTPPTRLDPVTAATPAALADALAEAGQSGGWTTVSLRLAYRQPFAPEPLFGFLSARALPGIESTSGTAGTGAREAGTAGEAAGGAMTYRRALRLPHGPGVAELTPADGYVAATLRLTDLRDLAPAVSRCRRLLDLSADPEAVDEALSADPVLAADVAALPGVRQPRAVDGFEMLCRAIVGQQVSVAAARRVLGNLAEGVGEALPQPVDGLTHLFPSAEAVAKAPDELFAMPVARRKSLRAAAEAVASGDLDLEGGADAAETREKLLALPGVGPWTASYVALRALGDPDAFLATDLGVQRGAAALGLPSGAAELAERAESWRPWRSYAVIRLWRHA
jgi:AraC family transcriptional regulator of adaptative response / DNA-3-methyladenine glycosylase II